MDLLHNTLNTAPALPGVPQVTTIHDVIYKRFPETAGRLNAGVALLVPLAARRSRRVITVSEASKEDMVRFLGADPSRVDVAPNGPGMAEPSEPVGDAELRSQLELGEAPIVLTVAAKRPHKNLGRLLDAFDACRDRRRARRPRLRHLSRRRARGASRRPRSLPRLGGRPRRWTASTGAATCFVLPSLAEGFGLPVLEAMAREQTAVACSDLPVLREVAGDAALYFDPLDTSSIAAALERCLTDSELRGVG